MSEKLQQIGDLTRDEAQVLKVVLLKSVATVSTIATYLKKKPEQVATIVAALEQKQLLRATGDKLAKRYVAVPPYGGFLKYLDAFINNVGTQRDQVKGAADPKNLDLTQIAKTTGEETEAALKPDFDKIKAEALANNQASTQELQKVVEKQAKDFEGQKGSLKRDITGMLDKYRKNQDALQAKFEGQAEKTGATLGKDLGAIVPPLEKAVTDQKAAAQSKFNTQKSTLETNANEQAAQVESIISNLVSSSQEAFNQAKSKITADVQASLQEVENLTTSLRESAKTNLNSAVSTLTGQVDAFNNETAGVLTGLKSDLSTKLTDYKAEAGTTFADFQTSMTSTYDVIKSDLDGQVTDLKNNLAQESETLVTTHLTTMREKTTAMRDKLTTTVEKYIDQFMAGADSVKNAVAANIKSEVEKVQTQVKEALAQIQAQYIERIQQQGTEFETEVKNSINDKVVDMRHELKLMGEEFAGGMDEAFGSFETGMQDTRQKFLDEVESFRTTLGEKMAIQVSEGSEKVTTIATSKHEAVSTLTDNSNTEMGALIDKSIDGLGRITEASKTEISEKTQTNLEGFESSTGQAVSQLKETTTGKVESDIAGWETAVSEFSTKAQATNETLKTGLDTFKNQATAIVQENLESLTQALSEAMAKVQPAVESFKQTSKEGTTGIVTELTEHFNAQKGEYLRIIDEFTPKVAKTLDATVEALRGTITAMDTKTQTLVGKIAGILGTSAASVKGKITAKVDEAQKKLAASVSQLLAQVIQALNAGIEAANDPKKALAGAWAEIVETELLDADVTWHLIGEDSIYPYLTGMINRAKSSIFIVTRSYKDLDWGAIYDAQSRGKKFVVACDLSAAPQKKLQEGLEKGIDLWDYNGKDIIGIIRDQEEILLAAINPKQDETVALISEMEPFVVHLGGMMNDYWRRHARKYTVQ